MGSGPYFSVNESILIYVNNLAICENGVSDAFCRNVTNQLCDFCEKSKIPSKPFLNDTTCVERCDTNTLYGFIVGQTGKITGHCKACDM